MALLVQKFGGSSVGTLDRIQHVAKIITRSREQGHDVVVVVSAMQGETDRLIQLAEQNSLNPNPREYDVLVASGEQMSAALMSMALNDLGTHACSYLASQVKIVTDACHKKARIIDIHTDRLRAELRQGRVPVVAGFQGVDEQGHITTFGRGGSDLTAVALAAALQADECQIFTDVDGVYTSDPRVVQAARRIDNITFPEMIELAGLGAKVLQKRAVDFAHKYDVPLRVLSTFAPGDGTLVTNVVIGERSQVSGIAFDKNQAKLTIIGMPNQPGMTDQVLDAVGGAAIDVDMVVHNHPHEGNSLDFSFTVHREDYARALKISQQEAKLLAAAEVVGNDQIAKLSLVGLEMKTHAGVASKMFQTLGQVGIPIHLITSTEVKISAVIDEKHLEEGAKALHEAFDLSLKKA